MEPASLTLFTISIYRVCS